MTYRCCCRCWSRRRTRLAWNEGLEDCLAAHSPGTQPPGRGRRWPGGGAAACAARERTRESRRGGGTAARPRLTRRPPFLCFTAADFPSAMGPATVEATERGPDLATASGHRPGAEEAEASQRNGGTATTSAGGGAAANLATPPPPALLPTVKPKKRKRKDASGPTGPAPGTGDCRDLIYGAGVRLEERERESVLYKHTRSLPPRSSFPSPPLPFRPAPPSSSAPSASFACKTSRTWCCGCWARGPTPPSGRL